MGFEIPNRFAIGYGLDHAERFRNLPYVAVLRVDSERPHRAPKSGRLHPLLRCGFTPGQDGRFSS